MPSIVTLPYPDIISVRNRDALPMPSELAMPVSDKIDRREKAAGHIPSQTAAPELARLHQSGIIPVHILWETESDLHFSTLRW